MKRGLALLGAGWIIMFAMVGLGAWQAQNFPGLTGPSGGGTANALVKFTSATATGNAAITDNGTTITTTEPLSVPATGIVNPGGNPVLIAKTDLTAQAANIGTTTLYAVPASGAGMYRISAYIVLTQAASVSSTLPIANLSFTDNDTNIAVSNVVVTTNTGLTTNGLGENSTQTTTGGTGSGTMIFNAKASTNIQYSTALYASSGATPMQYAIHVKLEYLGQ